MSLVERSMEGGYFDIWGEVMINTLGYIGATERTQMFLAFLEADR